MLDNIVILGGGAEHYTPLPVANDIEAIRAERDSLARKLRDRSAYIDQQNALIRRLSAGQISAESACNVLRKKADDEGTFNFDMLREVLIGLGARP